MEVAFLGKNINYQITNVISVLNILIHLVIFNNNAKNVYRILFVREDIINYKWKKIIGEKVNFH
jgi:hypothetical protein